jgi:hypothetical protein
MSPQGNEDSLFEPNKSPIAVVIPEFALLKHVDGRLQRYCEPYIVSMAIDEGGACNPAIDFNFMPFPKVRVRRKVRMLGDGHMLYGPKNPGSFLAVTALFMESDRDMQEIGKQVEGIVKSKAVELGMGALVAANPAASSVLAILKELSLFVSGLLRQNKDDELFRIEGTFLRDHPCPYHINREYDVGNDYIESKLRVIPLGQPNGQGAITKSIKID